MPDVVFITARVRMSEEAARRYLVSTKGRPEDYSDWGDVYQHAKWSLPSETDVLRDDAMTIEQAIGQLERSEATYRGGALEILVETNTDDVERSPWAIAMVRHVADFKDGAGTDTILVHTDPDGTNCSYEGLRVAFRFGPGTSVVLPPGKVPRREWKSLNLGFEFIQKVAFGDDAADSDDDRYEDD